MVMTQNIFDLNVTQKIILRIENLNPEYKPKWGKMNVAQALAHLNVPYEYFYEDKYKAPNFLVKLMLKLFVKKMVVNEIPYKENLATGPDFIIADQRQFDLEKTRLISFIRKTQELGQEYFHGQESHSFGVLTGVEWNNMFYKHLDHHLRQFGV